MDPQAFNHKVKPLLKYNKKREREFLRPQIKQCEHCPCLVKDQTIVAKPYRVGSALQHYKHICYPCKAILFDGSIAPKKRRLDQNTK
jgi:hypothetical protein